MNEDYRIIRPDGSVRWIRARTCPVPDESGRHEQFVGIAEDITSQKQVEADLNASLAEIRALAGRLQTVREEERKKLARQIHDELGATLTAIKIDLSSWIGDLPRECRRHAKEQSLLALIDRTIRTVRHISTELRPGILDDLGLIAAAEWAVEDFEARTGIKCRLSRPAEEVEMHPEVATALFRILQEALTNVARHAQATQVKVRLGLEGGFLCLEVRDNGRGFNTDEQAGAHSLGIRGMKERALLLGGQFAITSAPGRGTTVRARIAPAGKPEPAA